jgi:hypothetical protein
MRFTAFLEVQLNPGMRDISLYPLFPGQGTLNCRWTKPIAVHASHTLKREDAILYAYTPTLLFVCVPEDL